MSNEFIVQVSDKCIPFQKMFIFFPLIQNLIPFQRRADRVEHIAVGLTVNAFLEGLNRQAQIDFIGGHILADIRQIG